MSKRATFWVVANQPQTRRGRLTLRRLICAALATSMAMPIPSYSNDGGNLAEKVTALQAAPVATAQQLQSKRQGISSAYVAHVNATGSLEQQHHKAFATAATDDFRPETSQALLKLAEAGCVPCMGAVAERLYDGHLKSTNPNAAFEWATKGMSLRDGHSSYVLGRLWLDQKVVRTTAREMASPYNRAAVNYFRYAGAQGYRFGYLHSAQILMRGVPDVPRDTGSARLDLMRAAGMSPDPESKRLLEDFIRKFDKAVEEEEKAERQRAAAREAASMPVDPGMVFLAVLVAAIAVGSTRPDVPPVLRDMPSSAESYVQTQREIFEFQSMMRDLKLD